MTAFDFSVNYFLLFESWTNLGSFYFQFNTQNIFIKDKTITEDIELKAETIRNDSNNTIGKNIRKLRKAKGIGQTELAAQMNLSGVPITREALVKIERGIQHVQLIQLRAIKDILGVSYDQVLE